MVPSPRDLSGPGRQLQQQGPVAGLQRRAPARKGAVLMNRKGTRAPARANAVRRSAGQAGYLRTRTGRCVDGKPRNKAVDSQTYL